MTEPMFIFCGPERPQLVSGKVRIDPTDPPSIDLDRGNGGVYQVEFRRLATPAAVLDWIAQLDEKNWVTDEMMRDFIRLLNQIGRLRPWPTASSAGTDL